MAALVGVGPKAVTITLRGTDGLGHYRKRESMAVRALKTVLRPVLTLLPSRLVPTHSVDIGWWWGGKGYESV